jgi:fibronectin type 3 domain-containing protein
LGETKNTEYLDKGVTSLTSYAYSIVSVDSEGTESQGNAFTLDFCRVTPPKVLSATPETNAITVKWEAVDGIDSYRVYRTTDNSWVKISDVKASETSFIDTTVNSGTQYKYTVTSVKNNSESYIAEGNFKSATYVNRPSDITASLTVEGISLSWETIDKYSNFILYKRVKGENDWKELTKTTVSNTTYHDKAVSSGVVYEYAIKAVSADGTFESGLSSIKEVIFLSKIETVKVSSYAGGVKVSWSAVNGAEEYAVYRRLSTGSWEVIKTVSASTLSYKDTKAESGKDYSYTVRAIAKGYRSAYQKYDIYYRVFSFAISVAYKATETMLHSCLIFWISTAESNFLLANAVATFSKKS